MRKGIVTRIQTRRKIADRNTVWYQEGNKPEGYVLVDDFQVKKFCVGQSVKINYVHTIHGALDFIEPEVQHD